MSQSVYAGRKWLLQRSSSEESSSSDDVTAATQRASLRAKNSSAGSSAGRSPSPYRGGGSNAHLAPPIASSGTKLAQEIHDEFLVCKICLEGYKNPKCLSCLHTFCEQCIDNHVNSEPTYKKYSDYREFTCPLCRKRTQLPVGGVKKLPDNFLVSSLTEVVGRQKPSKYPFCDICKMINRKHREATSKCLDCSKLLCANCVQAHRVTKVTSGHSLFDVEIEKDIECKEHQDEVVRFYCEPCESCICVLCTFNEHKDHEITQFSDAVVKYKANIQGLLSTCKKKIDVFDSQIDAMNKCEVVVKVVEQMVHDTAIEFIQDIRNREKQMIEELQNIYGKDCMTRMENKKELTTQVENLRTTCSLTEVVLLGKDIELLLLKRDVQEKLSALNSVDIKTLPPTINKIVDFVAGSVDLGYIHDHDRPLLSKSLKHISRRSTQDHDFDYPVSTASRDTQTDPDITKLNVKVDGKKSHDDGDSSSDSDNSSSDDSDEEDSDDENKDKTEGEAKAKSTQECGTMTETKMYEDKAICTNSCGLQTVITAAAKPVTPVAAAAANDSGGEDPNSLMARRRQRRERAQTMYIGPSDQAIANGGSDFAQDGQDGDSDKGASERRRVVRSTFSIQNRHSVDSAPQEDVFYDATQSPYSYHNRRM